MKVKIVHNPTAGDAEYSKEFLMGKVGNREREVFYVSTEEENWEESIYTNEDLIVLTGGDGTIRKFANVVLHKKGKLTPVPVYLLPQGTANNIATTLKIDPPRDFIFQEVEQKVQNFNHGRISGLPGQDFFIEGVGYGIFPKLIQTMKAADDVVGESSEEKLQRTLKTLKKLTLTLEPKMVELVADGSVIKGEFLMAEILNTRFVGPKLELAPHANVGDDYFDLVLIEESDRQILLDKIELMISGRSSKEEIVRFSKSIKVKKVLMRSSWPFLHVDDVPINNDADIKISAEVAKGKLRFF